MAVMKRVFCLAIALVLCLSMGAAFAAEEVISFEEFMGIEGAAEAVENGDIPKSRHESYCVMMEQAKEIKEWEIAKIKNKSNENLRR